MRKITAIITAAAIIMTALVIVFAENGENTSLPQTYEEIFEKDRIIDVKINISEADKQDMFEYATNEEYHSADITVDGVTVENVGIRTKGNTSLSSVAHDDSDRYSFRIKFNKYVKKQTLLGLDELCLNNQYSDASYMREYLHYEVLREMGMAVPETVYCNVYVNDELLGFYLAVEGLDDSFLEDNFENPDEGNFYKMEEGADLKYREDETYSYAELKNGTDKELTVFKNFIKSLNEVTDGEKGNLEEILDVDSALKYIASNTVLCNYDSYNGNMHHNYYLYADKDGKFTVVPWDFNMSFGGFGGSNTSVGIDTPVTSGNLDSVPLIKKLLAVDEYKEKYYEYIKEMMEILEDFSDRVEELKEIIKPYVEADPTAFYTVEQFEQATTYSEEEQPSFGMGERPEGGMGTPPEMNENGEMPTPPEMGENGEMPTPPEMGENGEMPQHQPGRGGMGGRGNRPFADAENGVTDFGNADGTQEGEMQKPDGMPEGGMRGMGGGMGGGSGSIINCVVNRLENLKAQFDGTADKETVSGNSGFGGGRGNRPEKGQNVNQAADPNAMEGTENNGENANPGRMNPPEGGMGGFGGRREQNASNSKIRVHVNGHVVSFETDPYIEDGSTLVPYRAIMEAIGAEVEWNESERSVTAKKGGKTIKLIIDSDSADVDGENVKLDVTAKISDDHTLVPLRFISETLGMSVSWDENTRLITVTSPKSSS